MSAFAGEMMELRISQTIQPEWILLAVAFLVGQHFIIRYFSLKKRVVRNLNLGDRKSIGSFLTDDYGTITGKAFPVEELLRAPITGRKCVLHQIKVEVWRNRGRSGYWDCIADDTVTTDIVINDQTGMAYIEPEGALIYIEPDRNYNVYPMRHIDRAIAQYLDEQQISYSRFWGINNRMRVSEGIIEPDETIAVCGKGSWRSSQSLRVKVKPQSVLYFVNEEHARLFVADEPVSASLNAKSHPGKTN